MRVPLTQRQTDRFVERNSFLFALLGLISSALALDTLLAVPAREHSLDAPHANAGESAPEDAPAAPRAPTFVDAALGLLALRQLFEKRIAEWASVSTADESVSRGGAAVKTARAGESLLL